MIVIFLEQAGELRVVSLSMIVYGGNKETRQLKTYNLHNGKQSDVTKHTTETLFLRQIIK